MHYTSSKKIQENIKDINSACSSAYRDAEQDLKFDPPVYRQRYGTIHDVLLNAKWRKDLRKIVEFGCAEFGLFIFIKNLIGIEEINFVDIDEQLLKDNLFRVRPLTCEYLRRRPEPLTINVFAGSIIDPDRRILDSDVVIGIEIIEHLYPDILEAVPYTIFHCIQPKLAIFTTPNADFNELLPNLKKFRHYDHKFEWSREQFQSWATNITERFPQYFASFHGIGAGPKETQYLGSCSQMVVFVRRDVVDTSYILSKSRCFCRGDMKSENKLQGMNKGKWDYCVSCCPMQSYGICTYYSYANHFEELKTESQNHKDPDNLVFYKLLQTEDFPFYKDDRTQEQKLLDELKYKIYNLGNVNGRFFNVDKFRSEIPLVMLTTSSLGQFISESEVRTLLSSQGYKLEECRTNEEDDEKQLCVIYEPEMENSSSSKYIKKIPNKTIKMDNNRKHLKALHDSGLTKNTPKNGTSSPIRRENPDKILNSCINLKESSLRKQIKAAILSECKLKPLFSTESLLKPPSKPLPDPNKVNELDCLNNRNQSRPYPLGKTFFSQLIRTQFRFSSRKTTRNNCRDKTPPIKRKRKKSLSDSEDEVISDIKSIANCLLENTLNKLNIKESSRLIFDHLDDPVVETPPNGSQGSSNFEILTAPAPSTSSSQEQKFMEIIKNKQLGSLRNSPDSGSESNTESQDTIESSHSGKVINGFLESSREALFDPTSQVDLLEDFEIPPVLEEFEIVENVSVVAETNNVVLIGVNLLNENDAAPNGGVFPDWLLQMLRTNFPQDGEVTPEGPHFYCQGDGLGVHPSIIAIDLEDEEGDASSESSSSTNGSANLTETQIENSMQDIVSLPDYDQSTTLEGSNDLLNIVPLCEVSSDLENSRLAMQNEESEEYFDTTDELTSSPKKLI